MLGSPHRWQELLTSTRALQAADSERGRPLPDKSQTVIKCDEAVGDTTIAYQAATYVKPSYDGYGRDTWYTTEKTKSVNLTRN